MKLLAIENNNSNRILACWARTKFEAAIFGGKMGLARVLDNLHIREFSEASKEDYYWEVFEKELSVNDVYVDGLKVSSNGVFEYLPDVSCVVDYDMVNVGAWCLDKMTYSIHDLEALMSDFLGGKIQAGSSKVIDDKTIEMTVRKSDFHKGTVDLFIEFLDDVVKELELESIGFCKESFKLTVKGDFTAMDKVVNNTEK